MTTNKRFTKIQEYHDDGICEDTYYDTVTFKTYSFCDETSDERFLNDVNNIINDLMKEKDLLERLLECSRGEANDYCEELMGKDEFIRLYKRQRDEVIEENKELKQQNGQAIDKIMDAIVEIHDGKRDYAESILNEALELIK